MMRRRAAVAAGRIKTRLEKLAMQGLSLLARRGRPHAARLNGKPFITLEGPRFFDEYRSLFLEESLLFSSETVNPFILDLMPGEGLSTLFFLKIYPQARVTAWEPSSERADLFRRNMVEHGAAGVALLTGSSHARGGGDLTEELERWLTDRIDLLKMPLLPEFKSFLAQGEKNLRTVERISLFGDPSRAELLREYQRHIENAGFVRRHSSSPHKTRNPDAFHYERPALLAIRGSRPGETVRRTGGGWREEALFELQEMVLSAVEKRGLGECCVLGGDALRQSLLIKARRDSRDYFIKARRRHHVDFRIRNLETDNIRHEFDILAKLQHPSIIKPLDIVEEPGFSFMIMPFLSPVSSEAPDLGKLLGTLEDALLYLYESDIVHLDVTRSNIVLAPDSPRIILVDFEVAKKFRQRGIVPFENSVDVCGQNHLITACDGGRACLNTLRRVVRDEG